VAEGWTLYTPRAPRLREPHRLISVPVKFLDYRIEESGSGGFRNGELLLDTWFRDGACQRLVLGLSTGRGAEEVRLSLEIRNSRGETGLAVGDR
jgi:hypothetical protein